MRNKNKMDKQAYVETTLFLGLLLAWIYRISCYSDIYGITVFQSRLIFWALILVLIPVGILLTYKRRRNCLSIAVNLLLPVEIYTIASTYRYIPVACTAAIVAALLASLAYFAMILLQKAPDGRLGKKLFLRRLKFASLGARTIICVLLLTLTVPLCVRSVMGHGMIRSDVSASIRNDGDEWSLDDNRETVEKLRQNVWETLSVSEKLDVIGTVKNIEMRKFGVNHEVYLDAENISGNAIGTYDHSKQKIVVDIEHLKSDSAANVLNTVLHECRHVYQYMIVELYEHTDEQYRNMPLFDTAACYREEFEIYISASDDAIGYYLQKCEIDARKYADSACEEYNEVLGNYNSKNNQNTVSEG